MYGTTSSYTQKNKPVDYSSKASTNNTQPTLPRGICRKTCLSMGLCTCKD